MSAIMAINNVSMEEQIGMLTGVTEITRNASSASRGLVMISSRLTQVLDSTSSTGKKLTAIYNDLGIALKDENGQLRSHYDILGDLAVKWNTLSENEQKYIALTSAGARQQQNFVALMENWNQVASATTTAYESMGSAQRENEKVMDSVAKKVEILRSEFQQIVIGDGGLQEFAKGLLDVGVEALKLVDSLGGLPSILITLTSLIVSLNALNIYKNITNVISAVKDIPMILTRAILSWNAYKAGVMSANAAMEASMPIIGAIGAAIGIIISAIVAHNKKLEEQKEKIRENIQAFSNEYKSLDDISKKLQDENISREELNQIIDSNLDEYEAERLKLLNINDAREKTIDLIEAEKEARAQELVDTGLSEYEESLKTLEEGFNEFDKFFYTKKESYSKGFLEEAGISDAKTAKEQIDSLRKLKEAIVDVRKEALDKSNGQETFGTKKLSKEISEIEGLITELNEEYKEHIGIVNSFDKALNILGKHYNETSNSIEDGAKRSYIAEEERRKGLEKLKNETKKTSQSLADLKKQYNITDDAIYDYIDAHQDEVITIEEATQALIDEAIAQEDVVVSADKLAETYKDVHGETKNLISNISKLSSALKEQSENGSIAVETQLDLIESGYGAALMYDKETGACKLDEKAVVELTQAKLEMQIANLNIERSKVVDQLIREANQAVTTAGAFLELAKAKNIANQASLENSVGRGYSASYSGYGNNGGYLSDDIKESRELLNSYNKEIEALEKELKSVKTNGAGAFNTLSSGAKKSAGATKSATDAQKDLNKELEDTLDKYKKVISWISTQYDKEIDSIKVAKDEAIEAEEAKIKAKEKEKDAALDYIQQKINALEKEKKALKAQKEVLDDRKEALKDEEDAIVDGIEKRIKALEKERDAIIKPVEDKIKALEKERDAIVDSTENKIKALEKERDAIIDATQAEIDSINELKEARQNYWDEQIDALKKANQELKDNLELQEKLDALEKAKNTKVKIYKEGQGFVYDVDQTEVDKAQKALDEYLSQKAYEDELARLENLKDAEIQSYNDRLKELNDYKDKTKKSYDEQLDNLKEYKDNVKDNYDKQLDDLNNYKDNVKENYSEQIEALKEYKETVQEEYAEKIKILEDDIDALETHMSVLDEHKEKLEEHKDEVEAAYEAEIELLNEHKDNLEAAYDAEIEMYEDYKQAFEDMVNAYEEEQNRLLAEQLTGISFENNNWMTRLDNLANFVNEYNRLQAQLDTGTTDATNTASMSSGGGSSSTSNTIATTNTDTAQYDSRGFKLNEGYTSNNSGTTISKKEETPKYDSRGFKLNYASGADSIKQDQIAIVGENPNQEIVIGSKINNGELMSLDKGTGIVNAGSSKTLAGMLNQVGQFGSSGFGSGNGTLNNNINNDSLVVNGVTIEGSQIKDPETFVNGLLNLKAEALQRAYRHR